MIRYWNGYGFVIAVIILGMVSANERPRYNVTSSLIAWAGAQNYPCHRIWHYSRSSLYRVENY